MKKLLLMCCILLGITAVSRAQGGRQRMTPEQQTAALKTSLALTDAQATKVMVIYTAQAKSSDSLRTATSGDRDAMRAAMGPMRTKYMAQINSVLTADQQAAWKKQMEEMRAKMQQGGGGGMGGGGGN
jgi:protein CpxP